jgi:ribosomal protein L11 methyltransferase
MTTTSSPLTYEFNFDCPQELCHYASELCLGIPDVDSVMLRYKDDADFVEQPYAVAVFSPQAWVKDALTQILNADELLDFTPEISVNTIEEADWAEAWKAFWDVDPVIEGILTICPSWKTHTPQAGEVVLDLDPGSAFGTGAHETTRLMLQQVYALHERQSLAGKRLMDLGCGSGILAIYAAKLGAIDVLGLDIDAQAIVVSEENARLNAVEGVTHFEATPIQNLSTVEDVHARYPVMLVNILGPVIIELLPSITQQLAPQATLLCSGLIEKSCDDLEKALESYGFSGFKRHQMNQWFALEAIYNPHV